MKRYEMTGRPVGAPIPVLVDRTIGDVFSAKLDDATESMLIANGAIREVTKPATKEAEPDGETEAGAGPSGTGSAASAGRGDGPARPGRSEPAGKKS